MQRTPEPFDQLTASPDAPRRRETPLLAPIRRESLMRPRVIPVAPMPSSDEAPIEHAPPPRRLGVVCEPMN